MCGCQRLLHNTLSTRHAFTLIDQYSYSTLYHVVWRGQKSQCFVTISWLRGGSVSVETVCRCQMSWWRVMVTSLRAMGNFHRLQGRQRRDCLLTNWVIWRKELCVCVCVLSLLDLSAVILQLQTFVTYSQTHVSVLSAIVWFHGLNN